MFGGGEEQVADEYLLLTQDGGRKKASRMCDVEPVYIDHLCYCIFILHSFIQLRIKRIKGLAWSISGKFKYFVSIKADKD